MPVDAPDGTHALNVFPKNVTWQQQIIVLPFESIISTSIVGFPRESKISRA